MKLITDPDGFFATLRERDVDLKKPALLVLLLTFVAAYIEWRILMKMSEAFPPKLAKFIEATAAAAVPGTVITTLILWIVVAGVMHLVSAGFGGSGSFKRTLEFTGYGFLPSLVGSLISGSVSLRYLENIRIPAADLGMFGNPELARKIVLSQIPSEVLHASLS